MFGNMKLKFSLQLTFVARSLHAMTRCHVKNPPKPQNLVHLKLNRQQIANEQEKKPKVQLKRIQQQHEAEGLYKLPESIVI